MRCRISMKATTNTTLIKRQAKPKAPIPAPRLMTSDRVVAKTVSTRASLARLSCWVKRSLKQLKQTTPLQRWTLVPKTCGYTTYLHIPFLSFAASTVASTAEATPTKRKKRVTISWSMRMTSMWLSVCTTLWQVKFSGCACICQKMACVSSLCRWLACCRKTAFVMPSQRRVWRC